MTAPRFLRSGGRPAFVPQGRDYGVAGSGYIRSGLFASLGKRDESGGMKLIRSALLIIPALVLSASALLGQDKPRVSPQDTVNASVGDAKITIVYGRPYTKDPKSGEKRKIWGGLVPFGKVWRMGANEATTLTTDKDITIGGTAVPAGSYSLYLWPEEGAAKLIVNK